MTTSFKHNNDENLEKILDNIREMITISDPNTNVLDLTEVVEITENDKQEQNIKNKVDLLADTLIFDKMKPYLDEWLSTNVSKIVADIVKKELDKL